MLFVLCFIVFLSLEPFALFSLPPGGKRRSELKLYHFNDVESRCFVVRFSHLWKCSRKLFIVRTLNWVLLNKDLQPSRLGFEKLKDKEQARGDFIVSEKLKCWLIWLMDSPCHQPNEPQGPLRLIKCFVKWKIYSRQLEFYFTRSSSSYSFTIYEHRLLLVLWCFLAISLRFPSGT